MTLFAIAAADLWVVLVAILILPLVAAGAVALVADVIMRKS